MNLNLIKISMTTLTIKEAILLEDFNSPKGIKLYWAKAHCSDYYLNVTDITGGAIQDLGGGGYLIRTNVNLIPGYEITLIKGFDFDNIRTSWF